MYFFEWPYGIGKRESAQNKNKIKTMQCNLLLPFLFVNCFWIDFNLFLFLCYSLSFFLFFTHTIHNNNIAISGPMWNFYQRNICHSKFESIWWHDTFYFWCFLVVKFMKLLKMLCCEDHLAMLFYKATEQKTFF